MEISHCNPRKTFFAKYSLFCVRITIHLEFFGYEPQTNLNQQDTTMKTKAIIATGLVTLALLAGCSKEKETATTAVAPAPAKAPAPAPVKAPAPVVAPAPAPAPAPAAEGK
ncbi:MAG: hypothetical protein PHI13_02645 [Methylococcales bacterium]|nr:hypothetical protein [Methylococcales bacterium]